MKCFEISLHPFNVSQLNQRMTIFGLFFKSFFKRNNTVLKS